jgi:hypothetical protein
MRIALIADILVTIVMGGGATAYAAYAQQADTVLLAAVTWLFLACAWTFVLTMSRGTWSPSALDTAAFVDVSIRRCRSALAAVWFAGGLFLCELLFCLGWIYARSPEQRVPVWVWLATVVFFGFLVWYWRKKSTELTDLLSLREGAPGSTVGSEPRAGFVVGRKPDFRYEPVRPFTTVSVTCDGYCCEWWIAVCATTPLASS